MLGLQPLGTTWFRLETGAKVDPAVGLVLTGIRGGQSFMDQVAKLLPPLTDHFQDKLFIALL